MTYRHSDPWPGILPAKTPGALPRTAARLRAGEPFNFYFFGDSIAVGANASGRVPIEPFTPIFPIMTVIALQRKYGSEISYLNHAVGGMTTTWGVEQLPLVFAGTKPALMFINFGMNDASCRMPVDQYIDNMRQMLEDTLKLNPECEFVLCSTTLPNPFAEGFPAKHEEQEPRLLELCTEYGSRIALVPMTSIHRTLLSRKPFPHMTGNNINHPNDFLARVYAQVILEQIG